MIFLITFLVIFLLNILIMTEILSNIKNFLVICFVLKLSHNSLNLIFPLNHEIDRFIFLYYLYFNFLIRAFVLRTLKQCTLLFNKKRFYMGDLVICVLHCEPIQQIWMHCVPVPHPSSQMIVSLFSFFQFSGSYVNQSG